jgi:hypothetical protein
MERDESLLTFVPKHQPHTSETLDQRKPAKHAEFRVIAQDEWQSVVRYPAAQMMDVMNTNIGGEPAHNARQIVIRATVKRSLVQAPDVITIPGGLNVGWRSDEKRSRLRSRPPNPVT